eukprot:TRINITY_DN1710_c0_g1_i1.p1 TRINITY_DN1710_c0_g1~~TRINITY_DN1710_c0_g1_i1.p1  ORF type:complete len:374 (+),score=127.38 TRINITY_DN1710_c0_g1_i1:31-1152(+)
MTSVHEIDTEAQKNLRHQAEQHEENGQKALKTGIFKWSEDHDTAAFEYSKAADIYNRLNDWEKLMETSVLAAQSNEKLNLSGMAGKYYTLGGKAASMLKQKEQALEYFDKSVSCIIQLDQPDRLLHIFFDRLIIISSLNDNDIFNAEVDKMFSFIMEKRSLKRRIGDFGWEIVEKLLEKEMWDETILFIDRLARARIEVGTNPDLIFKEKATVVLIELYCYNVEMANHWLSQYMKDDRFCKSYVCTSLMSIITGYSSGDGESIKKALQEPEIKSLHPKIYRMAHELPQRMENEEDELLGTTKAPLTSTLFNETEMKALVDEEDDAQRALLFGVSQTKQTEVEEILDSDKNHVEKQDFQNIKDLDNVFDDDDIL